MGIVVVERLHLRKDFASSLYLLGKAQLFKAGKGFSNPLQPFLAFALCKEELS